VKREGERKRGRRKRGGRGKEREGGIKEEERKIIYYSLLSVLHYVPYFIKLNQM
jgi:hypothetical protein